jgi:hypothetical protein
MRIHSGAFKLERRAFAVAMQNYLTRIGDSLKIYFGQV